MALGLGATLRHLRQGALEWPMVWVMLAGGLPGVIGGAAMVLSIPDRVAQLALGVLIAGVGVYSWVSPQLGQVYAARQRHRRGYLIGAAGLVIMGILNGSLTAGTGLLVTLWLIRRFGFDYKRAVAHTLVMVGVFWNGSGAITLGMLGEIHWGWIPALLLGSLLGGYIGAHLAWAKGNRAIKRAYEIVTLLVGVKLMLG